MNTIFISELRVETRIGVYEWEQHLAQPLLLDLEIEVPSAKAFKSDNFADALDYAAVVKRLQAFAADHPHKLLERFAEAIADILRGEFGAPWVEGARRQALLRRGRQADRGRDRAGSARLTTSAVYFSRRPAPAAPRCRPRRRY